MKELTKKELFKIQGGASITGTMISAVTHGINTILDFGRSLGTAIRRLGSNNVCPI